MSERVGSSGKRGAGAGSLRFRRVILKVSGEALGGARGQGVDLASVTRLARKIGEVRRLGVELGVVLGGGNILRGQGASRRGMTRVVADTMGMLATLINALALEERLTHAGVEARVLSPLAFPSVAEPYVPRQAVRYLEEGRVLILGGGTGSPFFTTDTAAALRAVELGAQALLKATKVDGIYTADPVRNPRARRFDRLDYLTFLERGLKVMDATAITLCMDHRLPIIVFNLSAPGGIARALRGERVGTLVGDM